MPSRAVLQNLPAFRALSTSEIDSLAGKTKLCSFPRKSLILTQGDPSDNIYFLISGYAKIVRGGTFMKGMDQDKRKHPRKEVPLAIFGPGRIIGELASLANTTRSASAIALTDCTLAEISNTDFIDCCKRNPETAIYVMRYLASVVVESNQQLELMSSNVEARVIRLIRHLESIGLPSESFPTNAEIGRMVGASRPVISKIINEIQSPGIKTASPGIQSRKL